MRMESPLNQRLRWSPPDVVYTPIDVTSRERPTLSKPTQHLSHNLIFVVQRLRQDVLDLLDSWFAIGHQRIEPLADLESNHTFGNRSCVNQQGTPGTTHTQLNNASPLAPRSLWLAIDFGQGFVQLLGSSRLERYSARARHPSGVAAE